LGSPTVGRIAEHGQATSSQAVAPGLLGASPVKQFDEFVHAQVTTDKCLPYRLERLKHPRIALHRRIVGVQVATPCSEVAEPIQLLDEEAGDAEVLRFIVAVETI